MEASSTPQRRPVGLKLFLGVGIDLMQEFLIVEHCSFPFVHLREPYYATHPENELASLAGVNCNDFWDLTLFASSFPLLMLTRDKVITAIVVIT